MLPTQFCEKMQRLLGGEYEAFLEALDRPRAVGLRWNPRKTPKEGVSSLPAAWALQPVAWEPNGYSYAPDARPGLHPWHDAGAYYLQEPSAMAPAALLAPQPGERVLDLCAAPGGKSTQLAGRMAGRGLLVCNEIHPKRAQVLAGNVERLGIANALVLSEHPTKLAERFAGYFDRVLVDAPCSGEGMFRKHEAAWADWSPETVAMCARRQAEILDAAAAMLRPGGRLVYSTCTFSPEENEGSVQGLLDRHPEFRVIAPSLPFFAPGRPDWMKDGSPALADTCRLWPHRLRGEGHFAAVLARAGEERTDLPGQKPAALPGPVRALLDELQAVLPEGVPVCFGDTWFLAPPQTPCLDGLRVLRPGLELASVRKDRAVPAHALALWLDGAASVLDLDPAGPEVRSYLRGETLPCGAGGWTLVRVGGLSLGWGKASGGVLKNHYPKGLRR